ARTASESSGDRKSSHQSAESALPPTKRCSGSPKPGARVSGVGVAVNAVTAGGAGRLKSGPTEQPASRTTQTARTPRMLTLPSSLVAERFDRVQTRPTARRIVAEEEADGRR